VTSPATSPNKVNSPVHPTKARDGFIDQAAHIVVVAHVGTDRLVGVSLLT
jgi:hypothetical protein